MDSPIKTTRLLIVDDHPLVRSGIKAIMQMEPDLEVCGEAESHAEAMDLVLSDWKLPHSPVPGP